MNYNQLIAAIQSYTENQFPDTYLADGSAVSATTQLNTFIQQAEQRIYNTVQFPVLRKNVTGTLTPSNKYLACPADFLSTYSLAVIAADGSYEYLLNKDVNFIRQAYPQPTDTGLPKYYALFGPTYSSPNELTFILGPTPDASYSAELHYFFYPPSIVPVSGVVTLVNFTAGSGYTDGNYYNLPLTGGSGSGATVTVTVAAGAITSATIVSGGSGYVVGDTLALNTALIKSAGTAGTTSLTVTAVQTTNASGTSWLGDNLDSVLLYGSLVEAYTFMKGEDDMVKLYNQKYMEALQLAKRLGDGLERSDAYRSGQARIAPLPQNNGVQ